MANPNPAAPAAAATPAATAASAAAPSTVRPTPGRAVITATRGDAPPEPTDADLQKLIFGAPAAPAKTADDATADDDDTLDGDGDTDAADSDLTDDGDDQSGEGDADTALTTDDDAAAADDTATADNDAADDADADTAADEPVDDAAAAAAASHEEDRKIRARFTPEQQKLFDKAMQKKARAQVALKTTLAEREQALTAAQQELETLRTQSPVTITPTAENPLANIEDETALDKRIIEARSLRRLALKFPGGTTVKNEAGEDVEVTPERIGEILAETEELIQEHAPKRRAYLHRRAAAEAEAVKEFPWLKNKQSEGYVAVEATLRNAGHLRLRDIPDIKQGLADMYIGRAYRMKQKAEAAAKLAGKGPVAGAAGARGNTPPKAPATPAGGTRPGKTAGAAAKASDAHKTLLKTGRDPGNTALMTIIRGG